MRREGGERVGETRIGENEEEGRGEESGEER